MKKEVVTRCVGTKATGIRCPIIRPGDDLISITIESVMKAIEKNQVSKLKDRDIILLTESILARAQNNIVTLEEIVEDLRQKYKGAKEIGIIFPILSRNRFSKILEAISMAFDKVYIILSYPSDEVGNYLVSLDRFYESGIGRDLVLTSDEMYERFGTLNHEITGVDYVQFYKEICSKNCKEETEVIFANDPRAILKYTKNILVADIHTRKYTKKALEGEGLIVKCLDEIMTASINGGTGYNPEYGLLGSNMSSEGTLKLFPRDSQKFVDEVQKRILRTCGIKVEVMIYGDGAYKDPSSKIWELADPVVSPGYTKGLEGTPNEIKMKYIADNELSGLSQEEAQKQLKEIIKDARIDAAENQTSKKSLGTTPRQITSLLGSLADLVSGSGDKGTPMVLIQDYFTNYAD